jgi:hypothetical protein
MRTAHRWIPRPLRALPTLCAVALAFVGFTAVPSASAASFQKTLPLNSAELDDSGLAQALDLARGAGVTQVQTSATWWWLTRGGPGTYDWSSLDRLVAAAESRGLSVVLQLQGTPDWVHPDLASSVPDKIERSWYPPVRSAAELEHWANFVRDVVSRYRGRVTHVEIWNEQNTPEFWKPAPDVDAYAQLLRTAYHAAREADPSSTVVFGGLSRNDIGFLNAYYESADRQWPDEARSQSYYFDQLGVHPYSAARSPRVNDPAYSHPGQYGEIDTNFIGFRRLKQLMDARDVAAKPVYLGEYGFSTAAAPMGPVPDPTRAEYLRDAYNLAAAEGYVSGMAWYAYHPHSATPPDWAIVDHALNPSQTFEALRHVPSGEVPTLIGPQAAPPQPEPGKRLRALRVRIQRLKRLEYVAVVRCGSENCAATARGTLVARSERRRRFRMEARTEADAGSRARLVLDLPKRARSATVAAIKRGGGARARVKVTARDAAGNAVVKRRRAPVRA